MKVELSKLEARLIDEANNLKMINKFRNFIHYLMKGTDEEDYDNYITASELLSILEDLIWKRIEKDDLDDEESLRESLKSNLSDFKTIISKYQISFKNNDEVLEIINDFKEVYEKLFIISKKNLLD